MARINRAIALFLLFFGVIFANPVWQNFDENFAKSNTQQKQKFHQELKSEYVKAVINNNQNDMVQSLQRLVISSKSLGLDSTAYENELSSYQPNDKEKPKITAKQPSVSQNLPLKITKAIKNSNSLELVLNKDITKDDIKFFRLNSKGVFRNVYDIGGIYTDVSTTMQGFLVDEIRITQFNPTTIRAVFASKNELNLELLTNPKRLIFTLSKGAEIPLKAPQKPVQNQPKEQHIAKQTNEPKIKDEPKPTPKKAVARNSKIIMLDAGHGGSDVGAIGEGKIYEKNVVLAIALKTGEELTNRGYKVYYTRTKDRFINLRDRTKMANDKLADLFISIHANAAPNATKAKTMHGVETFFLSPARSERSKNAAALENKSDIEEMNYFSQQTFLNFLNREKIIASNKLAIDVQREVLASVRRLNKTSDGGVREAPFWVLVGALMPAVLLEVGYITHPTEGHLINTPNYQSAIARGLADGIDIYFANKR